METDVNNMLLNYKIHEEALACHHSSMNALKDRNAELEGKEGEDSSSRVDAAQVSRSKVSLSRRRLAISNRNRFFISSSSS